MYRHCVHCAADLGSNREIEEFPVGRRLAFDPERGRLWVVCRHCERWNLSPIEERWEALEALERRYRDTRTRVSTEHIGLARLDEGLELVRVGRPRRPEFAAWRYGDQFGRRRRKFIATAAIGGGIALGVGLGSMAVAGASSLLIPLHLFNIGRVAGQRKKTGARIPTPDGRWVELSQMELGWQKIRVSPEYEGGWALDLSPWVATGSMSAAGRASRVDPDDPPPLLTGADAVHALSLLLPRINATGASGREVRTAVDLIEDAGSAHAFFPRAEHHARQKGRGYNPLRNLPRELRLGLEMAAHEDQERRALEGELARLEEAWKQAEEIAAIADDLLLPASVVQRLARITRR